MDTAVAHISLGDAITESGCPFLFRSPSRARPGTSCARPLRIRTGKKVERLLVFPVFLVLAMVLIPGAWQFGADVLSRVFVPPAEATP